MGHPKITNLSTEEMLNANSVYNDSREQCSTNPTLESKLPRKVIGSMEIKAFYPFVKPEKVALVVRHMWNKSNIKEDNVNKYKLALYVSKEISLEKKRWLNLENVIFTKKPIE